MFRRPSSRRKSESQELQLNLVPMMDALVTMVAFLLISMGYLAISAIDTPAPLLAPADQQEKEVKKDKPPLQLTAHIMAEKILISDWSGGREAHEIGQRPDPGKNGEITYDFDALHKLFIAIKLRYPEEKQIILKPEPGIPYEAIVSVMDAARAYEKTDTETPPVKKNKDGVDEPDANLFPEAIFGNILEVSKAE